jgi:phytoene/squalene synthetase
VPTFALRRPFLILRDLYTSREKPDLRGLGGIAEPRAFVWAILPHAARTFSACIRLLPSRSALPAAVAYLYCRMLDTYEDLVPDAAEREAFLRGFASRLDAVETAPNGAPRLPPAPSIRAAADRDDRDRAHLLLVERADLVDRVFLSFPPGIRGVVRDLVRDMAEGMCWSSATFASEGGVLHGEERLTRYCRNVLGNPVAFSVRLLRMTYGHSTELTEAEREDAMRVGELVQLANITRDIEKDMRRGIAYDEGLRPWLGHDVSRERDDRALAEACRAARERLLRMALVRAPSYARVVESIRLPRWSVARASAVLMLLFTERYFRACARRAGMIAWSGPDSPLVLFALSIPAAFSRRHAAREIRRVEREFLAAARQISA